MLARSIGAVCALWLWLAAPSAFACAACACGDPTLTVMGSAQPFDGRLRLSVDAQHRTDAVGRPGVDRVELSEQRLTLSTAYAPVSWLMTSVSLPIIRRTLTGAALQEDGFIDPGDVELRVRAFVYRDRAFAPRHLVALVAGLRLPTGPVQRDASGTALGPELSAGSGSFDPLLGVSYTLFSDPWSVYLSEMVTVPTEGRGGFRSGTSWRGTHVLQYQFDPTWAARAGLNTRLDEHTTLGDRVEPDTGGFILFAMPSLVVSPLEDLIVNVDVHIPVLNALTGRHDEGVFVSLGIALDV